MATPLKLKATILPVKGRPGWKFGCGYLHNSYWYGVQTDEREPVEHRGQAENFIKAATDAQIAMVEVGVALQNIQAHADRIARGAPVGDEIREIMEIATEAREKARQAAREATLIMSMSEDMMPTLTDLVKATEGWVDWEAHKDELKELEEEELRAKDPRAAELVRSLHMRAPWH